MTAPFKRLAIYCGSATPADPVYIENARMVGATLAGRGIGVVYGGGRLGLMGAVADAALELGGEVIGIIPEALGQGRGRAPGLHRTARRARHARAQAAVSPILSDGFVVLPGGVGTMDELWEAISWSQLGYHSDPVGLLNINGYYDQLIAFNRHMIDVGFIRPQHADILIVDETLDGLLDKMEAYRPHRTIFAMTADDL